ncbi:MFS transporter [Xylanimonas sp. McL0601]|uniref:MFS transporter n=1 Tax=Xylanimonas sp. McL0601 TaxID=3414739 RepID=UPI003CF060AF
MVTPLSPSPSSFAARTRSARVGVAAFYAVQGLCFGGLLAQVPTLQHGLGMSDGALTVVLLLVPVVAGAGSVLAGVVAPRTGSAVLLRVAGPLVGVAVLGTALVGSVALLYPVVCLVGLLLGVVDATMNMQGVAVERRVGRSLLNSFHGAWSVGGILGSLAAVLAHGQGWSLVAGLSLVAGVAVAVDGAAATRLLTHAEETPDLVVGAGPGAVDSAPAPGPAPAARVPWRPIVVVGLAVTIMYVADSATSSWSTKYIEDVLGSSPTVAPLGLSAYLACQLLARVGADAQVNRTGPAWTVRFGGALGALGLVLVAAAPAPWVAIAGFGLTGLGLAVVVPLAFSAADAHDPTHSGVAVARVNLFNYAGFVLGAALIGGIAEVSSLRWAFAVPAVLAVGVILLAPSFRVPREPRRAADTDALPAR